MAVSEKNDSRERCKLTTIKQQIKLLKAWNEQQQQNRCSYAQTGINSGTMVEKGKQTIPTSGVVRSGMSSESSVVNNSIDEQPIPARDKNFEELLLQKMNEDIRDSRTGTVKPKQKYLKKGEGLARYRMTANQFKLKKKKTVPKYSIPKSPGHVRFNDFKTAHDKTENNGSCGHRDFTIASPRTESRDLQLFEALEEKLMDSSFCSTSSMIERLMENSMKSTPIKNNLQDLSNTIDPDSVIEQPKHKHSGQLDAITEEPSKLDETVGDHIPYRDVLEFKSCDTSGASTPRPESTGCACSECSCCEEYSHFISTSFSVVTEEKAICSPLKIHKCRTSSYKDTLNKGHASADIKDELSLLEQNKDQAVLKMLLRARVEELEEEIEAFKRENAHLTKIRRDYETEYSKFVSEKEKFFKNAREEREKELESIANEKKKLHKEKATFEKIMKEKSIHPTKQEREEIKLLKEQIETLKKEMDQKESRWAAAQARIRTQMRQLEVHNTALKAEIEQLRFSSLKNKTPVTKPKKKENNIPNKGSEKRTLRRDETAVTCDTVSNDPIVSRVSLNEEIHSPVHQNALLSDTYMNYISTLCSSYDQLGIDTKLDIDSGVSCTSLSASPKMADDVKEISDNNGTREKIYSDGRKEIWYSNGNVKKVSSDGNLIKTIYYNGDVKEVLKTDGTVRYYYAENKIWHTTYSDGSEIVEFSNGQIEKHHKDGSLEISYAGGVRCTVSTFGEEKWTLKDGTTVVNDKQNGQKIIQFPNKQKEIHTKEFKRREYPDGTVKIIYKDGTQETRYSNGRIRLRDKQGTLISDTKVS